MLAAAPDLRVAGSWCQAAGCGQGGGWAWLTERAKGSKALVEGPPSNGLRPPPGGILCLGDSLRDGSCDQAELMVMSVYGS